MVLTNEDRKWLAVNYPLLQVKKNDSQGLVIKGTFRFHVYYDETKDQYTINPTEIVLNKKYNISDSYEIEIASPPPENILPVITETRGRILSLARAHKLKPCDLHVDEYGICCPCPKLFDKIRYPKGINIRDFMYDLVIPFFYAQSFFEKYRSWPTGTYSHGDLGILEYYAELVSEGYSVADVVEMFFDSLNSKIQKLITNSATISRQWTCICDRGTKFRNCHPKAMVGLKQLKTDYDKHIRKQ